MLVLAVGGQHRQKIEHFSERERERGGGGGGGGGVGGSLCVEGLTRAILDLLQASYSANLGSERENRYTQYHTVCRAEGPLQ